MPFFDSKSSAGVELLRNIADSLSHASSKHDLNQSVDIAKPIAERVSLIKPRLEKELKSLVPGKLSSCITLQFHWIHAAPCVVFLPISSFPCC